MQKLTNFKPQSVICKLLSAIFLSVCIIFSICVYHSFAEVPCKINYQGRLIKDNVPVNEPVNMEFKLYTQQTGGEPIKTISINNVPVHNGLFRVVLDLEGVNWAAGETIYLEVKAGTDTLTPREPIYAYPYAINSHLLEGSTKEYFINVSNETQKKDGNLHIMGNVGIGTTSPDANLEVDNTLCLTPTDSPDHAVEGAIHYDDSEDIVKYHDGTGWKTIGPKIYSVIGIDDISTTSTTWTDMKDMSITENFPAGKLFITFNAEFYRGQWPEMSARIVVDNVEKAKIMLPYEGSSYLRHRIMHVEAVSTVTEGPHTIKVQWKTAASTLQQLGASKGQRILTVIQGN